MKLTTQDGWTIELSREYQLFTWASNKELHVTLESAGERVASVIRYRHDGKEQEIPNFYWKRDKILDAVVGTYATSTSCRKASEALRAAWKSGADEFTIPQDAFTKTEYEQVEDFAEEHGLMMLTLGEPGYTQKERAKCARLARETDYWEKHNYLVSDEYGSYKASLAKWKALNPEAEAKTA